MAKKIIYEKKEHMELIEEALKRKFPTVVDLRKKYDMMSMEQREQLFLDICNHYGESGWIIDLKPIQIYPGGRFIYLLRKQIYTK